MLAFWGLVFRTIQMIIHNDNDYVNFYCIFIPLRVFIITTLTYQSYSDKGCTSIYQMFDLTDSAGSRNHLQSKINHYLSMISCNDFRLVFTRSARFLRSFFLFCIGISLGLIQIVSYIRNT